MRIMQVPVFFFFWNVVIFIGWIAAVVMVYSVGDIDNGPPGSQFKVVKWNQTTRDLMYFMFFGILWLVAFVIACSQFVIIVECAIWYFSA